MTEQLSLAAEFPATSQAEWRKLVEAALKGAAFDKRLVSQTYDGLRVEPLYPRALGASVIAGRAATPWQVLARVDHPHAKAANALALLDLEGGATGLTLVFAGAPAARGFGVAVETVDDLDRVLAKVMLDMISLRLETAPFAGRPVATLLTALVERRKLDPSALDIDFGLDPIGDMARTGRALLPWPELSQRAGATAKDLADKGFAKARFLRVDGRAVHEAGGSEAQELAFALATGVAYLRLMEASGFALDAARHRLTFLMAADADEFLTIAKLRALRKLWARVEQACGLTPQPATVAAETAWRMMTTRDVYVNMLRATIAVTAAGLGGADAVGVLPFTQALGLPDAFARRVARNTQLVLLEESNLYRVADPAAASGGIENLTAQMAQAAVALLGFVAILFQIDEIRANNRAASARQAFLGYTDLAFKNPKFSQPDYDAIKAGSRDERVQYESFVSYFLYACEEAIAAFAGRPEWLASCNYDLKPHLPFLCEKNSIEPAYLATYSAKTQQWVKAALQTASVTPPDCKLGKT